MLMQQTKNARIDGAGAVPIDSDALLEKKASLVAKLIAVCLVGGFFAFFKMNSQILQELAFLALVIPAYMQIRYGLADMVSANKTFMLSLLYLIPVSISFLFNLILSGDGNIQNVIILMNLYFAFYIASVFASDLNFDLWKRILHYTALFALPLFVYVYVTQRHAYVWGRWQPFELQPNWWGMMALGVAWGGAVWTNTKLRITGLIMVFLFMVELQSRGSIVALLPVVVFSSGFFFPLSQKRIAWIVFGFIILVIGLMLSPFVMETSLVEHTADYVTNDIFLINDAYRGAGSGLTGRMDGYIKAWEGFVSSPVFGKGFGEYAFVHNGFLKTMAEIGLLGLLGMLFLFGKAFTRFLKKKDWVLMGLLLSYVVLLLTFPRTFNINMTGFMFIIVLMVGCRPTPIQHIKSKKSLL